MGRVALLIRLIGGLLVLAVVSVPRLNGLERQAEAAECARRRTEYGRPGFHGVGVDACPRGNVPYLYEVERDGSVAVRCPNGHGREPLRFHVWVHIP